MQPDPNGNDNCSCEPGTVHTDVPCSCNGNNCGCKFEAVAVPVCECEDKEHLGIGEVCCGFDDCECTLKVYGILANGVKIFRKGDIEEAKVEAIAEVAVTAYAGLDTVSKGIFDPNITEIHIVPGDHAVMLRRGTILELGVDTNPLIVQFRFGNILDVPQAGVVNGNDNCNCEPGTVHTDVPCSCNGNNCGCKFEAVVGCECDVKEHLGIGEVCCGFDDCECTLKVYGTLANGVKIFRSGDIEEAKMIDIAGHAVSAYAVLDGSMKAVFDVNITEIRIVAGDHTQMIRRGTILELGADTLLVVVQLRFRDVLSIPEFVP
jgi:hypothetical protein